MVVDRQIGENWLSWMKGETSRMCAVNLSVSRAEDHPRSIHRFIVRGLFRKWDSRPSRVDVENQRSLETGGAEQLLKMKKWYGGSGAVS